MSIFQTDLLLRSALIQALKDIRRKPWILDDIFSQCVTDGFLDNEFGYKEIGRARKWFEKTHIPIIMQHRLEKGINLPCVSVALLSSQEKIDRTGLGDMDVIGELDDTLIDPKEIQEQPIRVLGPFNPKAYDPVTGTITLPDDLSTDNIFIGQVLLDTRTNEGHPILKCLNESQFSIVTGVTADFTNAIVIPQFQALGVRRQRTYFLETYQLGVHAVGEASETLWLYSIIVYCLLRYKEAFLEARGIELSTFSASDFVKNEAFDVQNVFSRFITIQATVEHNWIAAVSQKVEGLTIDSIKILDGGTTPPAYEDEVNLQGWKMEDDED